MPRGDKSSYTGKQKRQAEHIEEGYESRGVSEKEAERRAWATVNKETGGGKKSGSGRGKAMDTSPSKKGGKAHCRRTFCFGQEGRGHAQAQRCCALSLVQALTSRSTSRARPAGDQNQVEPPNRGARHRPPTRHARRRFAGTLARQHGTRTGHAGEQATARRLAL
jgi:plasmid stabilization system protein ParE